MKVLLPKSFKKSSAGFTLIELMVVIAIIAILAAVGLTIFSGQQKAARDAKRRTDVDAIATAFEAAYTAGTATPYVTIYGTSFAGGALPTDPNSPTSNYTLNGATTITAPTAPAASFTVCASLENNNGNSSTNTGTPASGAAATFYCRKNQQG